MTQPPMSQAELEMMEGYFDGRDLDTPAPSSNRSHCYRHSFAVGRAEKTGEPFQAHFARAAADRAEAMDASL